LLNINFVSSLNFPFFYQIARLENGYIGEQAGNVKGLHSTAVINDTTVEGQWPANIFYGYRPETVLFWPRMSE
jgi:hypothetical protein